MSYTSTQYLPFDSSTTAAFDLTCSAVSAAIAAMGWTKTSDTGQVNWASNPAPPASGASLYEIWQPNDSLQTGSTKFFLRLDYSLLPSTGPYNFVFTLGTGTDGAGNLTGFITKSMTMCGGVSGAGSANQGVNNLLDCYFSGDVDRMNIAMFRSAGGRIAGCMGIERTKNADGTNSSDGVTLFVVAAQGTQSNGIQTVSAFIAGPSGSNNINQFQQTLLFVSPSPAPQGGTNSATAGAFFCIDDGSNTSSIFNNSVAISPVFPWYGKFGNPQTIFAYAKSKDMVSPAFFTTTLYGATRTYVSIGGISGASGVDNFQVLCMRYD